MLLNMSELPWCNSCPTSSFSKSTVFDHDNNVNIQQNNYAKILLEKYPEAAIYIKSSVREIVHSKKKKKYSKYLKTSKSLSLESSDWEPTSSSICLPFLPICHPPAPTVHPASSCSQQRRRCRAIMIGLLSHRCGCRAVGLLLFW
jgi:hypothetical protein